MTVKEVLLYPPTCLSYNWPEGDPRHLKVGREVPHDSYTDAVARRKVGDVIRAYAGAPGTGHVDHRITRIDDTGVYAIKVEDTIRELRPSEVE